MLFSRFNAVMRKTIEGIYQNICLNAGRALKSQSRYVAEMLKKVALKL